MNGKNTIISKVNPVKATKGLALSSAARHLGISEKEITAYGDSLNDLSMLQTAGRSVAVANARPEILSFCSDICPSNQEDGVACFLSENVLREEVSF